MATNKSKPKGAKLGASASNLLASFPWLKNKTFLIPALASVLVVSLVGVVLAVQGSNTARSDEGIVEVPLAEPELEIVAEPVIGAACVEGEPVCEFVKVHLLSEYWEDYVRLGYDGFVDYILEVHDVSRDFAEEVLNAVEFNWGNGSTASEGGSGSESSTGASSGDSRTSGIGGACVRGKVICEAAIYVLIESDQGKSFTRENFIEVWMSEYGATRVEVEGIISAIGFTNWAGSASSSGSGAPGANLPTPEASSQSGLSPSENARSLIESINAVGSAYSRLQIIDYMVSLEKIDRVIATSALDGLGVNWNLQATKAAGYFANQTSLSHLSRVNFQEMLKDQRFTASEAIYGVDSLGINWNAQASRAGKKMLESFPCTAFVVQSEFGPSADIDELASYIMGTWKFTEDEAYSGAFDQLETEGDWVWKVFPNCVP
jgi:hypothetical protein